MSMQIAPTADQVSEVRGGFIWIAAFAIGAAVGYGCRKAGDAVGFFFCTLQPLGPVLAGCPI